MILAAFLVGMILCALTLALIRAEDPAPRDKFGSAIAMFAGWCAFGMLLLAGAYGLGIILPAISGAIVLALRTPKFGQAINALAAYKLPFGVGALVCSVIAWVGILNLMEDIPYG